MKVICFHNPDEENGYLSNWYPSVFQWDGITFSSMEQYMMYWKALTFSDIDIAEQILKTDNVGKIKALGREVSDYKESIWNGRRQIIVYRGLLEKFRQNPDMTEQLLCTGNMILAECAVMDKIWGIGLGMKDENRFDMDKWKGQNLLGYALMEVREELRK
ncbi:MAG: NADAR family protein [Lachnospiraceae bacterium]|nr:NADAR family protein [Lachnospiraceae bacterium]